MTFIPSVSEEGVLSWTNNGGLDNPQSVTIKGADGVPGENGAKGTDGKNGVTFTPSVDKKGLLSWKNDGDLPNPPSVNIKGDKGDKGDKGEDGGLPSEYFKEEPNFNTFCIGKDAGYALMARDQLAIGNGADVDGGGTAVGNGASSSGGTAVGNGATVADYCCGIAIGTNTKSNGANSSVIGSEGSVNEENTLVLSISDYRYHTRTQLYLVGYGAYLSYNAGTVVNKPVLGYTVDDGKGKIRDSGWIALEDLCTNKDFNPKILADQD